MNNILEDGDLDEALSAAHAVGDDAIQSKMQGHMCRIIYTEHLSKENIGYEEGYKTGDIKQGNTFDEIR
jgi:predicted metalloprotease